MNKIPADIEKQKESQAENNALIREILGGNTTVFALLQKKYRKVVLPLIRRMIRDDDEVEDLLQETFIKVYNALPTFQEQFTFSSWIYRIASNTCIDFLRKKRFKTISLSQPLDSSDNDSFFEIEDDSLQPDKNMMNDERRKILYEAVEMLPKNYKTIILLRHEEELDYKDIAERMNLPLGTVKAHLFRARKILSLQLKKQMHLFVQN